MIVLVVIMHDYHEHDCNEYWSLMVFVAAAYRWCRSHFEFLYHARISYDDWLQSKLLLVNILYLIIFDFSRPIFTSKNQVVCTDQTITDNLFSHVNRTVQWPHRVATLATMVSLKWKTWSWKVLKGLERPWTFSNNSALSVGFLSILFLSLPVACSYAPGLGLRHPPHSCTRHYRASWCGYYHQRFLVVTPPPCVSIFGKLTPSLTWVRIGENVESWTGWAPRLLPLLHPFAIVQDILFATASGCRESHCIGKNLFHQTWWR
jgi:hypothetical protein